MGKHEVGTPKYIANKMKAKGLQKLRWYCQMCEKQCRDENGFKCHTTSESHHRQLLLFADNQHKYMNEFSKEFSEGFLDLLKRQFGTKRVSANRVYQDYIANKDHIHMNATNWLSLTDFVKWLGRSGACVADETEKGWFITYIDRDPLTIAAQAKKAKKAKHDLDSEERMMEFIKKQVESGSSSSSEAIKEFTPLVRPEDDVPLVLDLKFKMKKPLPIQQSNLSLSSKKISNVLLKSKPVSDAKKNDGNNEHKQKESNHKRQKEEESYKNKDDHNPGSSKRFKADDDRREEKNKDRGWLRKGLIAKIITETLGEKYYKAKGEIREIVDKSHFVAKIKLISPESVQGHIVKIDQEHLETVIPNFGREVVILWGKYDGKIATIQKLRTEEFCVDIELTDRCKVLKRIPYEQICKYIN